MDKSNEIIFYADEKAEIDEHEYEISAAAGISVSWRRAQLLREHISLHPEQGDYPGWNDR